MSDYQPDPRTPPNVGGPLGVLLKWLDAFLTVIDNVYLKLKSWVRRKGSKGKRSKRSSKQQPMMEQAYTTAHSQPSTAYARKGRVSTSTERQRMTSGGAVSPVSPVSGTFSSSDHSHGAPVEAMTYDRFAAQPSYVPSQNNAYAVAMAKPDHPHPHASPKPASVPRTAETEAVVLSDPKPKTQVSRLVSEETPARSNSTRSKMSKMSARSSDSRPDTSAWKPSGPYRSPEQRHSGAFSSHSASPSASSHALGHAREPSHGSLAAIAASNSRRSGDQARYDAVRPLSPQYAPSPAQRSISPQYGRADTPSYNEFRSRPTSPPAQQWEPAVPTTTGVTGTKYAHVTTGRTGTKYAHVSADRLPSSPTSPTASSWQIHSQSEGHEGQESYNGGWNRVADGVDVDAAYKRWSSSSGASTRTRSTFGAPTHDSHHVSRSYVTQPSHTRTQSQPQAQQRYVPGKAYAPPPEDTASVSDFSDESLYDVPNPTASKSTTAQNYAAAYAANLKRRTASLRSGKRDSAGLPAGAATPTRAQTYVRRSEIVA